MAGVDIEEALLRIGGNRLLLWKILGKFGRSYAQVGAEIVAAVRGGDIDEATELIAELERALAEVVASCTRLAKPTP